MLQDRNCGESAQHTRASTYIHFVKAVRVSPPQVQVLQTGRARLAVSMLTSVDTSDIHWFLTIYWCEFSFQIFLNKIRHISRVNITEQTIRTKKIRCRQQFGQSSDR